MRKRETSRRLVIPTTPLKLTLQKRSSFLSLPLSFHHFYSIFLALSSQAPLTDNCKEQRTTERQAREMPDVDHVFGAGYDAFILQRLLFHDSPSLSSCLPFSTSPLRPCKSVGHGPLEAQKASLEGRDVEVAERRARITTWRRILVSVSDHQEREKTLKGMRG